MVRFLVVVLIAILAATTTAQADLSELLQQALLAGNVGDHDAAIHYLSLAIANGGLSRLHLGQVFASRGSAFENKGELEKAIADYSEAIKLLDGAGEAYIYRGLARVKQDRHAHPQTALAGHDEGMEHASSFESERPSRSRPVCHPGVTEHAFSGQNSVKSGGVAGRLECTARSWDNSFAELHFR